MKPHVIVIMADQLRPDVLGKGFTPNIDSIAQEGARFDCAYCSSPLCVPARGSFFTGTYPNCNGSLINPWEPLDEAQGQVKKGITNLYELLEGEWDCLHSGKQHLFTEGGKLEDRENLKVRWLSTEKSYRQFLKDHDVPMPGGSRFRMRIPEMVGGRITRVSSYSNAETGCYEPGERFYFDDYFTEMALEGLRNRDQNKPLFLSAMFLAPHPPLEIPEPWYDAVKPEEVQIPENVGNFYPRQSPLQMYNLTGIVGARYDREHWKEAWRVYLGLVRMLDHCVGRLLDELKSQGIYDDCLILFTSDHGEMLGSHGLFQKMCMYEEAARVPLHIRFPGGFRPVRSVYEQVVSHVDILPTLCEYLSLSPAHKMDGRSLMPLLRGKEDQEEGCAYIQYDGNGSCSNFQRCIVKGRYKLIVDLFKDETYYELYDLKQDVQETENLMFDPSYREESRQLAALLAAHMVSTGDRLAMPAFLPEEFCRKYGPVPAPSSAG